MSTKHLFINGDSRRMSLISDNSVQLIVTSPPYWQLKDYGDERQIGFNDTYEEYINNLNLVWSECFRVLEHGCRLCINIGDQFARAVYYGRYKVIPIHSEIIRFCEEIGFDYMGSIIWQKQTSMHTTGGENVMGSFPYPRGGIVKIDFEHILLFKKVGKSSAVSRAVKEASKLSIDEWNEYFSSHWTFEGARQDKHIAVFPEELPKRLIKMFSYVGDTVLDPFIGSGTVALAARNLGRNSIGYEINKNFYHFYREKVIQTDKTFNSTFEIAEDTTAIDLKECLKSLPFQFTDIQKLNNKVDVKQNTYGSKFETDNAVLKVVPEILNLASKETVNIEQNELLVIVNHARSELRHLMIQKGICYLRAGDSKGSASFPIGFERIQYILLHTAGYEPQLYKLKNNGKFQIWTKETLIEYGFNPQSASYYLVFHFDNQHPIPVSKSLSFERGNAYRVSIEKYSNFI